MDCANHLAHCFLHGLESQGPSRKGAHLNSLGWEVFAPTINYRDPEVVMRVWHEALGEHRDAFMGSSMGGWMATLLASHTGTSAWLVNPAVISRSVEPAFPSPLGPQRPRVHVLFGRQDDLIDPQAASEWLEGAGFEFDATWVDEGHRIGIETFASWIQSVAT